MIGEVIHKLNKNIIYIINKLKYERLDWKW